MVHNLSQINSVFSSFIQELRDERIQKDSMRFRRNLERVAEILGYELSKKLNYKNIEVTTPLGTANLSVLEEQPVLATIRITSYNVCYTKLLRDPSRIPETRKCYYRRYGRLSHWRRFAQRLDKRQTENHSRS